MKLFEKSTLAPEVLNAISELGFETPTEIQSKAIPFLLETNQDLIALAQTGTGKTAAFGLPIISQIETHLRYPQALVICPTRELCLQIERDFKNYCKYLPITTVAVYGGASIETQLKTLKSGVHIVVATPGRLVDIIKRRKIDLSNIRHLVLDESDEMLHMGFQEDIDTILEQTPSEKRTLLFSATMPANVRRIANNYMNNPHEITIGNKNAGADTVSHHVYMVHSKDRYLVLKRIADFCPDIYGIVFCRTRQETKEIADKLMADGYNADALHGDLSQAQRDYVMKKFRNKNLNMLVATDVAARGLDVHNLTHVINYSLPDDIEVYTHRSGRTGRAGKEGISIAIINLREKGRLRQIERFIKKSFIQKQVPHGAEICQAQLIHLIQKIKDAEVTIDKTGALYDTMLSNFENFTKEELLQKFISYEFNRLLEYYQNAPDINVATTLDSGKKENRNTLRNKHERSDTFDRKERNERNFGKERYNQDTYRERKDFSRFFINIGKKNSVDKSTILRLLNEHINDRSVQYGAIDILKSFSFFEVEKEKTAKVLSAFKNAIYDGIPISVEIAQVPEGKAARGSKNGFIQGNDFFHNAPKTKKSYNNKKHEGSFKRRKR